jgi:hypothetical protein
VCDVGTRTREPQRWPAPTSGPQLRVERDSRAGARCVPRQPSQMSGMEGIKANRRSRS